MESTLHNKYLYIRRVAVSSSRQQRGRDLLEIIEARHKRGSTIFSSQFTPAGWHGKIGEGTLADAILDRIVHDSYTILIDGEESMRKRKGISI